jgi:DNA polymerase III epsilon subunit-like protein
MARAGLLERFEALVVGGICTLSMSREFLKTNGPANMKLETLAKFFLGEDFHFKAHDARGDTDALEKVYPFLCEKGSPLPHSMTTLFYKERVAASQCFDTLAVYLNRDVDVKKAFLEVYRYSQK